MYNFKIINIIGIDGAGKTTLAKSLEKDLSLNDPNIQYRYCQYFAKLLLPVKLLAKYTVMRKTNEFKDYHNYNLTKKTTSSRFPILANLYAFVWLIDYLFQVLFKITIPIFCGKKLIIDRYIYDIALNLSLTTNNTVNYAHRLINLFFKAAPKPDLTIFIDLPEEVAFARKNDIQGLEYLRERRAGYSSMKNIYDFTVLNGDTTQKDLLVKTKEIIASYEK